MNIHDDLSNWTFRIDEVSAGVYKATATDQQGRKVEMTGLDPDILLEDCRKAAAEINRKVAEHRMHGGMN